MAGQKEIFYERVLQWVLEILTPGKPFVLGVNGPQGSGKSTLTAALCSRMAELGKRAATVSVDDFYLTHDEQLALAARNPGNPFLQQRGYPGSHDLALGARILEALESPLPGDVKVPRYDKSQHHGEGDREPESRWPVVSTPLDLLILEGWMLGFSPVPEDRLPCPEFRVVNETLAAYEVWHKHLDGFLQLVPSDPRFVLDWRVEAEEKMKASGRPGMSEAAIRAYVNKFLPAYDTYLPFLAANPPVTEKLFQIEIGKNRLPLS